MEVIHCKLPDSVLVEYGNRIGDLIRPNMDCGKFDHACSDLVAIKLVDEIGHISELCNNSYTDIINSYLLMTRWVNRAKTAMCMRVAVEHWLDIDARMAFDDHYLSTKLENYPRMIHEDLSVYASWVIYMGADAGSIRRILPTKIQDEIRKIIKKVGASGINTMFWRSLVAYQSMTDKCIIPAYKECLKHGAKENTSFNQMQSAFAQLKKSA